MIKLTIIRCSFRNNMLTFFFRNDTPLKINMESNHGGLEDHVLFQMGDL